jgi:glycosyltransferase involved in cell wall biosynthesis
MHSGQIVILHEWDGPAYFQAVDKLVQAETGAPPMYRETWFIRQLGIGLIRRNPGLVLRGLRNAVFFIRGLFLKDRIVILGIAPYDWSLFFWARLRHRNRVIYHTSWLKWDGSDVVHKGGLFPGLIRKTWRTFLEDPRVGVVSVLPESGTEIRRYYRKEESSCVAIPHAVDLSVFRPAKGERVRERGPLRVLYLGRLNARKGVDIVAELITRADPSRFRFGVAGDGPEWQRLEPIKECFDYLGRLDGKEAVAAALCSYDILVLPSVYEPFGIVFIEAMACGVVCIASDGLFPKNLVVDGVNGRVVKRKTEDFLAALEGLHADPALREKFQAAGFERVKEFDLTAIGERWKRILEG